MKTSLRNKKSTRKVKTRKRVSQATREAAVARVKNGETAIDVAASIGVSYNAVYTWVNKGLPTKRKGGVDLTPRHKVVISDTLPTPMSIPVVDREVLKIMQEENDNLKELVVQQALMIQELRA